MTLQIIGAEVEFGAKAAGSSAHAEGLGTSALGQAAHAEGAYCSASAYSAHAEGAGSTAVAPASHAGGSSANAVAYGQWARRGAALGAKSQVSIFHMGATTTTSSVSRLTCDGVSTPNFTAGNQNVFVILPRTVSVFRLQVAARVNVSGVTGNMTGWEFAGTVVKDNASAKLVGTTTSTMWSDTTQVGTVTVSANTTDFNNNYLEVVVAPFSSSNTLWSGTLYVTELQTTT